MARRLTAITTVLAGTTDTRATVDHSADFEFHHIVGMRLYCSLIAGCFVVVDGRSVMFARLPLFVCAPHVPIAFSRRVFMGRGTSVSMRVVVWSLGCEAPLESPDFVARDSFGSRQFRRVR
jgi:hypothetical protein